MFDAEIFGLQAHGGISRYFAALLRHLPDHGVSARLLAPLTFNQHLHPTLPGFRGLRLPHSLRNRYSARLMREAQELVDRATSRMVPYDLLHRTMYAQGLHPHAPVVVTVHDMIPELFPSYFPKDPHRGKRAAVANAQLVFSNSETTKGDLVRLFGVPEELVLVTPLGVDHGVFEGPRGIDERTLLYVGSRGAYKDFATFARAAARVMRARPDVRVLSAGGGPWRAGELAPFVDAGVEGRVTLANLTDLELAEAYRTATLFVFPSLYEGFGLPILEAFAAGCPVLLARASCFPEVACDAAAYFEPGNADDIAEQLLRLLRDGGARRELQRRGALRVRDFTWERTAALTAEGYRRLLDAPRRGVG